VHTQRFSVQVEYPVVFTEEVLEVTNADLLWALTHREPGRRHRAFVVLDAGLVAAWPSLVGQVDAYFQAHSTSLELAAKPQILPGGEACKNDPGLIQQLHQQFQAAHIDRHSFVLCFGGGALQDAVGYAAATAHRGLRMVRLPTTVLGQNDSGVGVKNGINAFDTKNFLGTFAPPWAVVNDLSFLTTLERRDRVAGMAEAVKVALIRDGEFFEWLDQNSSQLRAFEPAAVAHLVRRTAELHLAHIATSGDPFETGSARPLDYGHWAAHKLESMTNYELRHGEAVAIGLALDSLYSAGMGLLPCSDARRICDLLRQLGFTLEHPALERWVDGRPQVLDGLAEFREHLGGELTLTLLRGIGSALEVHDVNDEVMLKSLAQLNSALGA
jgi:3-dehydroquinate synthase